MAEGVAGGRGGVIFGNLVRGVGERRGALGVAEGVLDCVFVLVFGEVGGRCSGGEED